MPEIFRRLSSKVIKRSPRLTLIEDTVKDKNGNVSTYLRFAHTGNSVTIICRRSDGQFLVQKEYSYPVKKMLFQFPGGFVPKKESLISGALRELCEEANLKADNLTLLGSYYPNNRRSKSKMFVYFASALKPCQGVPDPEEYIESFWFSETKIEKMIRSGEIENYSFLSAWSLYRSHQNDIPLS
jgi:ADP-ribose pyrophosphatase